MDLISQVVVPVTGVALFFVLMQKLLPLSGAFHSGKDLAQLKREYHSTYIRYTFIMLFALVPVGCFFYFLLRTLYQFFGPTPSSGSLVFLGVSNSSLFWILAFFLTISSVGLGSLIITRRALGDKFQEYDEYLNMIFKANYTKLSPPFFTVFWGLGLLGTAMTFNHYHEITDTTIIHKKFISIMPTVHQVSEVDSISHASSRRLPNGRVNTTPYFILQFKDGNVWEVDTELDDRVGFSTLRTAMELIAAKTNLEIQPHDGSSL